MGRKNNRLIKTPDKKFDKFVKTFMEEKRKEKEEVQYKKTEYKNNFTPEKDYKKERLQYAIQKLEENNIQYHIINEEKNFH